MTRKARSRMDEVRLVRAWSDWNLRSLNDYLLALLALPREERRKDRGASYGSIQDIFLHVIEDYIWWFGDVPQGRKLGESEPLVGRDLSEQELRRLTRRVDRSVHKIMDSLKPRDLGRSYVVQGEVNGKPYTMTTCLADIMWHMVEEQLQHIGELNALFWQMDIDPPTHAWFSSKLSFTY